MNIKEAKSEIIHTIMAYTAKNKLGGYAIPSVRQRPLLLIGPPGIGKTAVMEQAASACKVGFVSYNMTHHTRQSAIGLPYIEHRKFHEQDYAVTEYTMSEIIASVYRCIEDSGRKEGLLFLDEINCVSETLAPAILQFLQNKTFGSHRLPEGWVLAAAGNPPEYNKSVREFDIATLDRLKYIQVEADYEAWRPYALEMGIHAAIPAYLDTRPEQFYILQQTYASKSFATARGWEDLSCLLIQYEHLKLPVTTGLIGQYFRCEELARDFYGYYHVFEKRKAALPVSAMMNGDATAHSSCLSFLTESPFEEKLYLIHLMLSHFGHQLQDYTEAQQQLKQFDEILDRLYRFQKLQAFATLSEAVPAFLEKEHSVLRVLKEHGLSSDQKIERTRQLLYDFRDLAYEYRSLSASSEEICRTSEEFFQEARSVRKSVLEQKAVHILSVLEQSILLLERNDGPEFVLFLFSLEQNPAAEKFFQQHPSISLERNLERLQFSSREAALKQKLLNLHK